MPPFGFNLAAPTTLPFFGVTLIALLLTYGGVFWRNSILQSATASGTTAVARSPWGMIVFGTATALAALVVVITPDGNPGTPGYTYQAFGVLGTLFGSLLTMLFAAQALAVWIVDQQAMSYHALFFRHVRLPWSEVDWVYPQQKTTQYRYYGFIPAGKSVQEDLVIEAGPQRKILLPLNVKGAMNRLRSSDQLIGQIELSANQALFGYDKQAFVIQRRAQGVKVGG